MPLHITAERWFVRHHLCRNIPQTGKPLRYRSNAVNLTLRAYLRPVISISRVCKPCRNRRSRWLCTALHSSVSPPSALEWHIPTAFRIIAIDNIGHVQAFRQRESGFCRETVRPNMRIAGCSVISCPAYLTAGTLPIGCAAKYSGNLTTCRKSSNTISSSAPHPSNIQRTLLPREGLTV